jgi:hypothetical protein
MRRFVQVGDNVGAADAALMNEKLYRRAARA